jgi:hypothetical protein
MTHMSLYWILALSRTGTVPFFKSAICVSWSALYPPPPQAEQRMGQIVCGSDCHSECLDPLLKGRTVRFGGGRTVRPLWGRIVTICKRLLVETLQCRMVLVILSQCINGGWTNDHSTLGGWWGVTGRRE